MHKAGCCLGYRGDTSPVTAEPACLPKLVQRLCVGLQCGRDLKKGWISGEQVGGKTAYDLLGKSDLRFQRIGSVSLNGGRPDVTLIGHSY